VSAISDNLYTRRRIKNALALALSLGATLFGLFWLVWILWTAFSNGVAAMSGALFTQMTPPPGSDGGLLNAFFGSAIMSLLAIAIGAPIGIAAGTYLAEYARKHPIGQLIRFVNDILLSAPSIVLGNAHQLSASLLMPGNSIAATLANEFTEADSEIYRSSLIALGFLLFVVTFIVLAIAKFMLMRLSRKEGVK